MKFRYPKRWSRAKRKARRAVDIRACRLAEFMRVYKEMLDKIWGDPPVWFYGLGIGEPLGSNVWFVDDAEFLP